jgi:hypothetical protein
MHAALFPVWGMGKWQERLSVHLPLGVGWDLVGIPRWPSRATTHPSDPLPSLGFVASVCFGRRGEVLGVESGTDELVVVRARQTKGRLRRPLVSIQLSLSATPAG